MTTTAPLYFERLGPGPELKILGDDNTEISICKLHQ
jgi:hypothetical protein